MVTNSRTGTWETQATALDLHFHDLRGWEFQENLVNFGGLREEIVNLSAPAQKCWYHLKHHHQQQYKLSSDEVSIMFSYLIVS